jgi:hypothetical protein
VNFRDLSVSIHFLLPLLYPLLKALALQSDNCQYVIVKHLRLFLRHFTLKWNPQVGNLLAQKAAIVNSVLLVLLQTLLQTLFVKQVSASAEKEETSILPQHSLGEDGRVFDVAKEEQLLPSLSLLTDDAAALLGRSFALL